MSRAVLLIAVLLTAHPVLAGPAPSTAPEGGAARGLTREMAANRPLLSRHFDEIDADHDGVLSRDEVQAARQALLARHKARESLSHRERIRILQEAEVCIQASQTLDAYRACEERERAARQALREQSQPR